MSAYDTAISAILGNPTDPNRKPSRADTVQAFYELTSAISSLASIITVSFKYASAPAAFATTANVNLAGGGIANGTTHDGHVAVTGERVLVKNQTAPAENGTYIVPAAGAATRATDADIGTELLGYAISVTAGTANGGRFYVQTTTGTITIGTTALTFVELFNTSSINTSVTVAVAAEQARAMAAEGVLQGRNDIVVGRYELEVVDDSNNLLSARGTDNRDYSHVPGIGMHPYPDAYTLNPMGVGGFPEYFQDLAGDPTYSPHHMRKDWDKTLFMIPIHGASRAGCANDLTSDPPIDTVSAYPSLSLMPSIGTDPAMKSFSRFLPLIDTDTTAVHGTTCVAMSERIISRALADFGNAPRICVYRASQGGSSYNEIGPGTVTTHAFMKALANGVRAARRQGWRVVVPAVVINYGQDYRVEGATLARDMSERINMVRNLEADIRQITHQKERIFFVMVPPSNGNNVDGGKPYHMISPLRLHGRENIVCSGPDFIFTIGWPGSPSTGVHCNTNGYHNMGLTAYGDVIYETWMGTGFDPVRCESTRWSSGTTLDMYFSEAMSIDTSGSVVTIPEWGGLYGGIKTGIQFFTDAGAEIPITSISIVGDADLQGSPNRIVRLTMASANKGYIVLGGRNTFGLVSASGPNSGPVTGCRHLFKAVSGKWANIDVIEVGKP